MSGPSGAYQDRRVARVEQRAMDLWDAGTSSDCIAQIVASEEGCSPAFVKSVLNYMREGRAEKIQGSCSGASALLAARIMAVHGPGAAA